MELLRFIVANWDTVAVATVVLAILTGLLAYYTMVLAKEAKKTREQDLEPNIVVTIEPYEGASFHAYLIIENVGKGVAYDVLIDEHDNQIFKYEKREFKLSDLAFMKLKVLKPGQKIEHHVGMFKDFPSRTFKFNVTSKDALGKLVQCSNDVDVNCYYDRIKFNDKGIDDLVGAVQKIESHLNHITTGFRRLKVDAFNAEDREEERKELEERFKQQREQKSES